MAPCLLKLENETGGQQGKNVFCSSPLDHRRGTLTYANKGFAGSRTLNTWKKFFKKLLLTQKSWWMSAEGTAWAYLHMKECTLS